MSSGVGATLSRSDATDLPDVREARTGGAARVSYDEIQARAVFMVCERCEKPYYMTHPQSVCRECRRD